MPPKGKKGKKGDEGKKDGVKPLNAQDKKTMKKDADKHVNDGVKLMKKAG
jgi:hypothetical protein